MTSSELAALMARHGKTNPQVAAIAGISEASLRAMLEGRKQVPESVARLLLIVLGEAKPGDYIA